MREFYVNENDANQRLDKFISKLMPKLPKSMMYKGFRKNCVKVNGKHKKDGSEFVVSGDKVTLYFKDEFFSDNDGFKYVKPKLDIVYEDDNIIVVNKKTGVLSHSDEAGDGETLIDMIKSYLFDTGEYNPKNENTFKPALCNRLDRNTGGLIIAAKNASALREVNKSIKERMIRKFYTALIEGYPEKSGHLEGYLSRNEKVTSVSDDGKFASLDYTVKKQKDGFSLVEIELHTGRTHQIRAQFSNFGYPLAGDTKYGGHGNKFRQALYSTKLIFGFPKDSELAYLNGKQIEITTPLEKEF